MTGVWKTCAEVIFRVKGRIVVSQWYRCYKELVRWTWLVSLALMWLAVSLTMENTANSLVRPKLRAYIHIVVFHNKDHKCTSGVSTAITKGWSSWALAYSNGVLNHCFVIKDSFVLFSLYLSRIFQISWTNKHLKSTKRKRTGTSQGRTKINSLFYFICLCPLGLGIKMNFNIAKVAHWI